MKSEPEHARALNLHRALRMCKFVKENISNCMYVETLFFTRKITSVHNYSILKSINLKK